MSYIIPGALPYQIIKKLCESGEISIDPFKEESIGPSSYDVTLGNTFLIPEQKMSSIGKAVPPELIPPQLRHLPPGAIVQQEVLVRTLDEPYECRKVEVPDGGRFIIGPKDFVLATTVEYLKLPNNIEMFVEGRSSIGRTGLQVQNAGFTDPGFEGKITLELFNASNVPIALVPGRRIAQYAFIVLTEPTEKPYSGKYQGQLDTTDSKVYDDFEVEPHTEGNKVTSGGIHLL